MWHVLSWYMCGDATSARSGLESQRLASTWAHLWSDRQDDLGLTSHTGKSTY